MTIFTRAQGALSASILDMGTLATGTYIASAAIDLGATIPTDVTFQVECDPNGTPTGNKQLAIFAKFSLDGTNYGSGPESGSTTTEEADLFPLEVMSTVDTNTHRKFFSLRNAPTTRYLKIVVKNDMGVALTSGNVYKADITDVGT